MALKKEQVCGNPFNSIYPQSEEEKCIGFEKIRDLQQVNRFMIPMSFTDESTVACLEFRSDHP